MDVHHGYIETLEPRARPVAQAWADMDETEFKARIGPKVDALSTDIKAVLTAITELRDDHAFRSGVIKAAPILGLVIYGIADQFTSPEFWKHLIGGLR